MGPFDLNVVAAVPNISDSLPAPIRCGHAFTAIDRVTLVPKDFHLYLYYLSCVDINCPDLFTLGRVVRFGLRPLT
jgi:hypothetical protein